MYRQQIIEILEKLGKNGVTFTYTQIVNALSNVGLTNPSIWAAVDNELKSILEDENIVIPVPTPLKTPVFRLAKY